MRVLGIDPGTAITGYGVVDVTEANEPTLVTCGVIRTPATEPLTTRLVMIYDRLRELIAQHEPTAAAVEELFFSRNARTAMAVGHARGVALLALTQSGLPIAEYKPAEIKQALVGYGNADKHQMQQMVQILLQLDSVPQPDDAADAVAVAICHAHTLRYASLIVQAENTTME